MATSESVCLSIRWSRLVCARSTGPAQNIATAHRQTLRIFVHYSRYTKRPARKLMHNCNAHKSGKRVELYTIGNACSQTIRSRRAKRLDSKVRGLEKTLSAVFEGAGGNS